MNWRKKNPTCTAVQRWTFLRVDVQRWTSCHTCTWQCVHMGIQRWTTSSCVYMDVQRWTSCPRVHMAMCTHGYSAMNHEHMTILSIHRWTFCPRWQLGKGQFSDERFQARWYYYLRDSSAMNFFPKWQFTNELLTSDHIGGLVSSFICLITL